MSDHTALIVILPLLVIAVVALLVANLYLASARRIRLGWKGRPWWERWLP